MSRVHSRDGPDVDTVGIDREGEWFVATAKGTDVASQGRTVPEALANLAEALRLHDEGVPEDVESTEPDAPWFET